MFEKLIPLLQNLYADPYGFLFLILLLFFVVLFIFKKITKLIFLLLIFASIYLAYMFFTGQSVDDMSQKIKDPLVKEFQDIQQWSKRKLFDVGDEKV